MCPYSAGLHACPILPESFWKGRCEILNGCPAVLEESFFVGDAAGRDKDFADSDM